MSFILASASPRRKELLERIGARFDIIPAQVEEFEEGHADPEQMVRENAVLKAGWVARRHPGRFILGSDTTVHLDGKVLVKPADLEEAKRMLARAYPRCIHGSFTSVPGTGYRGNLWGS